MGRARRRPGRRARVVRSTHRGVRRCAKRPAGGMRAARPGEADGRLRRARRRLRVALVRDREGRRRRGGGSRPASRIPRSGGRAGRDARRPRLPVEAATHRPAAAGALRRGIDGRARPCEIRGHRRHATADGGRAGDQRQDRRRGGRPRRDRGLGPGARDRRGGPRRDAPSRWHDGRRDRRRAPPAVPGLPPRAGQGDRGAGRSGHQRVPARDGAEPGHLSTPQPDHQRARRRDGRRRGRCEERGPDHSRLGAGAGPRAVHRARAPRRSCGGRLPRVPARGGSRRRGS